MAVNMYRVPVGIIILFWLLSQIGGEREHLLKFTWLSVSCPMSVV